jgi:hypothetical protein
MIFNILNVWIIQDMKAKVELFGWKFDKWPGSVPEGVEYWMVTTVDDEGNNGLTGAMMKRLMPEQGPINYVDVKSLEEYSPQSRTVERQSYIPKKDGARLGLFCYMRRYRE